jgi:hypothetical protein
MSVHNAGAICGVKTEHSKVKLIETCNYLFEKVFMTVDLIVVQRIACKFE